VQKSNIDSAKEPYLWGSPSAQKSTSDADTEPYLRCALIPEVCARARERERTGERDTTRESARTQETESACARECARTNGGVCA